jgi:hypothetical protein
MHYHQHHAGLTYPQTLPFKFIFGTINKRISINLERPTSASMALSDDKIAPEP